MIKDSSLSVASLRLISAPTEERVQPKVKTQLSLSCQRDPVIFTLWLHPPILIIISLYFKNPETIIIVSIYSESVQT